MLTRTGELLGTHVEAIYHTGVVVFEDEYWFGRGLQRAPASSTQSQFGRPMETISLGWTEVTKDIFEDWLSEATAKYSAETYSLLEHNCNNFSDEASAFLCGARIPRKILDLPSLVMNTELGRALRPMLGMFEHRMRSTTGTAIVGKADDDAGARASLASVAPRATPRPTPRSTSAGASSSLKQANITSEQLSDMVRGISQAFNERRVARDRSSVDDRDARPSPRADAAADEL